MPGFTTHYILGMKAYNDMPQTSLKFIIAKYRWLYQLGLQGPDIFFYNLPILRHRDHRNVGSHMHEHLVNQFFRVSFENLTKIESRQQREEGLAYLYAAFCATMWATPSVTPYVYGRIEYDVDHPGGYYHGLHAQLENDIDALLLRKYKKEKPSQFNQAATICLNGMEIQFISRFLSKCINETYPAQLPQQLSGNGAHDPPFHPGDPVRLPHAGGPARKKKKNKIEFVESLFLKNPVASNKLVTDTVEDPSWSLNLHHETWCNPWNRQIASQASFPDLFKQSLGKLDTIYYMINSMIDGTPAWTRYPWSGFWMKLEITLTTAGCSAMNKRGNRPLGM